MHLDCLSYNKHVSTRLYHQTLTFSYSYLGDLFVVVSYIKSKITNRKNHGMCSSDQA